MQFDGLTGAPRSRREFLALLGAGALVQACKKSSLDGPNPLGSPRLTARPGTPTQTVAAGTINITAANPNDGYLVVPPNYDPGRKWPLVLGLHGAGQGATYTLGSMGPMATSRGFVLLAPGARGLTWDVISYKYSYDLAFIDTALKWAFDRCNIDPARVSVQGFSDGASYAYGLGLGNGDLFSRIVANSPGMAPIADADLLGKPKVFDSHGTLDTVLPIDGGSRPIVRDLKNMGYDVTYVEFAGGHELPDDIRSQAMDWMLA